MNPSVENELVSDDPRGAASFADDPLEFDGPGEAEAEEGQSSLANAEALRRARAI